MSQNGWLCCGGESGEFVAIHLDSTQPDSPPILGPISSSSPSVAPVLPIIDLLDPHSTADTSSPTRVSEEALRTLLRSLHTPSQNFGKDRVNCITLWFPNEDATSERVYKQPVAVLANNDKNVVFVSLTERGCTSIETVAYPDCVNRAVLSPDGTLCAAICDDPYLYINERVKKLSKKREKYEWVQRNRVHLKSQRVDDMSDNRGSFAVCFNNTGRFVAVGTQYGIISVFETAALLNPEADALVTSFGSSKPRSDAGAIRDMAFCPGPFDLLAWTEDRGGVGVADIRRHFISRQLLRVDKKDEFERVDVVDRRVTDPQRLSEDNPSERVGSLLRETSSSNARENMAADGPTEEYRAPSSLAQRQEADIRRLNSPLTREETLVLDALRETNRRNREARTSDEPSTEGQGAGDNVTAGRTQRENSTSVSRTPEQLRSVRNIGDSPNNSHVWRDLVFGSNTLRQRDQTLADTLRRGMRVRLGGITSGRAESGSSGVSGPASRFRAHGGYSSELEAIYSLGFDTESSGLRREQDLPYQPGMSQYREAEGSAIHHRTPPGDDETAGLAWSEDGRIL